MLNLQFIIERNFTQTPYDESIWQGDKLVETRQAKILAFYNVTLSADFSRRFIFEIRENPNSLVIVSDDDLWNYLRSLQEAGKKNIKDKRTEINNFMQLIVNEIIVNYNDSIVH